MKARISLIFALLITACAQAPVQQPAPNPGSQAALKAFRAEGRLAWSQNGKGDSARFIWTWREPEQQIDLLSPLGSVAATIGIKPGAVVLDTSDGGHFTASTLEQLTLRVFDMSLPLTGMEYWAQGLPIPDTPFSEEQRPQGKRMLQRGYTLDYPRWIDVNGHLLPDQVDIHRDALSLKLRIKQWILDQPPSP